MLVDVYCDCEMGALGRIENGRREGARDHVNSWLYDVLELERAVAGCITLLYLHPTFDFTPAIFPSHQSRVPSTFRVIPHPFGWYAIPSLRYRGNWPVCRRQALTLLAPSFLLHRINTSESSHYQVIGASIETPLAGGCALLARNPGHWDMQG